MVPEIMEEFKDHIHTALNGTASKRKRSYRYQNSKKRTASKTPPRRHLHLADYSQEEEKIPCHADLIEGTKLDFNQDEGQFRDEDHNLDMNFEQCNDAMHDNHQVQGYDYSEFYKDLDSDLIEIPPPMQIMT